MKPLSIEPTRGSVVRRRILFFALVTATILLLSWKVLDLLRLNGLHPLEVGIFLLFVILSLPLAFSFWTAFLGFLVQMRGGDDLEVTRALKNGTSADPELPLTAIVMPVYNEDPTRVIAGLKATYQSLERTRKLERFEFFILSDSTDPDVWVREELAFVTLRKEVSDPGRIFYRNRRQNVERKTGNIADFCASWGDRYKYMIVFDADSIMTGGTLVKLVQLMEFHPGVGIIQAPPLPVNRKSLFGRLHQFATHAYSSLFISGLNFWQGGAGNYWGHNAIIRIAPFVEHCRLPKLPGKAPLGGSILSHDFIEAAFMRRAGWRVYLAGELHGSYEEMPSNLIGYAARDRRWCQGNLQHGKLLFHPGLHFVSRVHIWMGMMGYLASPLWLLLLVLTTAEGIRQAIVPHQYFGPGRSLAPTWPVSVGEQALWLFVLIMGILLLPKLLSVILLLKRRVRALAFGGIFRLAKSVLAEVVLSTLLAPTLAFLQSRFVISILLGDCTKWDAQDRGDSGTPWREAVQRHWHTTVLGIGWAVLLAFTAPKLLPWFSPVILGFALSIPLSVWTSRAGAGLRARHRGLFLIPEETRPTLLLRDLEAELEKNETQPWARQADGLTRVLADAELCAIHVGMLPEPEPEDALDRHKREGLVLKYLHEGPQALDSKDRRELLLHPECLESLRDARSPAWHRITPIHA